MTTENAHFDSGLFTYTDATRSLCSEISDLGLSSLPRNIHIKSARTGCVLRFAYLQAEYDTEGEIFAWTYRNFQNNLTVTIFND